MKNINALFEYIMGLGILYVFLYGAVIITPHGTYEKKQIEVCEQLQKLQDKIDKLLANPDWRIHVCPSGPQVGSIYDYKGEDLYFSDEYGIASDAEFYRSANDYAK